jgi:hypothetical protein
MMMTTMMTMMMKPEYMIARTPGLKVKNDDE